MIEKEVLYYFNCSFFVIIEGNQMIQFLFAVLILVADIYAILKITQTPARIEHKVVWIAIVLILPLVGFLAWFFAGPGGKTPS
jgi:uncharacterized membrane protein YfcA